MNMTRFGEFNLITGGALCVLRAEIVFSNLFPFLTAHWRTGFFVAGSNSFSAPLVLGILALQLLLQLRIGLTPEI
jgi:hypothetical protein